MNNNKPGNWQYPKFVSFYKSLFVQLIVFGLVWGVGYMHWSYTWLIPAVIYYVFIREKNKDRDLRRLMIRATTKNGERMTINNRLDTLPSWVHFPDYDTAEWLNKIISKVWPNIDQYIRKFFETTVKKFIVKKLSKYKNKIPGLGQDIDFEKIHFGDNPPVINGIKVYDANTSRSEIVLDLDITYDGDFELRFSTGMLEGAIQNFQLRGTLRMVMKPLIPMKPIIGGIQIFFLECPTIDCSLVDTPEVLELLGLDDLIRNLIVKKIRKVIVLPNKYTIPLTKKLIPEALKTPEPEGVLRINVVEAKNLMGMDFRMFRKKKSDPYTVISIRAEEFKTKTKFSNLNPKWNYWCECVIEESLGGCDKLVADVFDQDMTGKDDFLGRVTIEISDIKKQGSIDTWMRLESAKHGSIHLRLKWLQLSNNFSDLESALEEARRLKPTSLSTAVLILYVASAKSLSCLNEDRAPNAYLEAGVGNRVKKTRTKKKCCDPAWEQGFTLLVNDPENDILNVKVYDKKSKTVLGTFDFKLSALLTADDMEFDRQEYSLQSNGSNSTITLSMALRILKSKEEIADAEKNGIESQKSEEEIESEESPNLTRDDSVKEMSTSSVENNTLPSAADESTILEDSILENGNVTDFDTSKELDSSQISNNHDSTNNKLVHQNSNKLSTSGVTGLGRLYLTLEYSMVNKKFTVVIHEADGLPVDENDPPSKPDSYVKLYLLPHRQKKFKRRTKVVKDTCNPIFDERFEYTLSQIEMNTQILELSVCSQKRFLRSKCFGQTFVRLSDLYSTPCITKWYDLQPESDS
ncbi:hypothetical protein QAD02_010199 [Eretmocerus hayati]|uniref:Uncharacterized protein n=1 Tax=Eretmocerus hayati TaxID=131215 RepID=A0ACC2NC71_9HYME|nr:hypothetical protein QAD02_010199 [Eretmocerus hayati]